MPKTETDPITETSPNHQTPPQNNPTASAPPTKSHGGCLKFFLLILLLGALGAAAYYYYPRFAKDDAPPKPVTFAEKFAKVLQQIQKKDCLALVKTLKYTDLSAKDEHGRTLLWYAVETNDRELVQLLLNAGSDIQAKDQKEETVLQLAARSNNLSMVQFLVKRGAQMPSGYAGDTLWGIAAEHGYLTLILWLKNGNYDFCENMDMKPALFRAFKGQHDECANELLTYYPKETYRDKHGNTVAMLALMSGNMEQFQKNFIPSQLNYCNSEGKGYLYACCVGGNNTALDYLINRKPELKETTFDTSPLKVAVQQENLPAISRLIDYGFAPTVTDNKGNNLIMMAVKEGHTDAISNLMMAENVDPLHENNDGQTVYDLAKANGDEALLVLVQNELITAVQRYLQRIDKDLKQMPVQEAEAILQPFQNKFQDIEEIQNAIQNLKHNLKDGQDENQTQALQQLMKRLSESDDYQKAIQELTEALARYPRAKNTQAAQNMIHQLKEKLANEERSNEARRLQQQKLDNMTNESEDTIRSALTTFINNWLEDMKCNRNTRYYWAKTSYTLYHVKSWEIIAPTDGWKPFQTTVLIAIDSQYQYGGAVHHNWTVTFIRNEQTNYQWKILSMEE